MKYIKIFLVPVILFTACNKDENKGPTKTEMLTSQSWKYDSGGIDQDRNGTVDYPFSTIPGLLTPCILDNTGSFSSNGTGVADEGATKCSVSAPQTIPFTWAFQNNETEINVQGPGLFGLGGKFTIKELTATSFSLSKDTTVTTPVTMTVALIVKLKH